MFGGSLQTKDHQQAIEEIQGKHQQAIEEKDAAQIQVIQYENVPLQAQRDAYQAQLQRCEDIISHLKARYVDHAKDPRKGNIVMIIVTPPLRKMSFMSHHTILRENSDSLLVKKTMV